MLLRAILAWMLIIAVEVGHGILRRLLVTPWLGEHRANQWGVLVAVGLTLAVAIALSRWIGARRAGSLLLIGLMWSGLTFLFEIGVGLAVGYDPSRIAADYDIVRGGLMPLGLCAMLLTPLAAAKLRGLNRPALLHELKFGEGLPYPANDDG
jgi:hypothetical protein